MASYGAFHLTTSRVLGRQSLLRLQRLREARTASCLWLLGVAACSNGTSASSPTTTEPTLSTGSSAPTPSVAPSVTPPSTPSATSTPGETTSPVSATPPPGASSPAGETSASVSASEPEPSGPATEGDVSSMATGTPSETEGETTSSGPTGAPWVFTASTNGQLHAFSLDPATGQLTEEGDQAIGSNGGDVFIANAPGSRQLFAVYNQGIVVFDFSPSDGSFTELARGETLGGGTYVGLSADEKHAYVAHYNENTLSYLTLNGNQFSEPASFPAGQKVHSAQEHASGGWVLVPCLGSNHVAQYRRTGDELAPAPTPTVTVAGGPRHFAYHPSKAVVYVLSELTGELRTLEFSAADGLGAILDTEHIGIEQQGQRWGSDIRVSPDGNDVFAIERNARLVYHFDVAADGSLDASGVTAELGGVVRAFDRSSDGQYLFMGNENGQLLTLRFDKTTNELTPVANAIQGLGTIHTTIVRDL